MRSLRGPRGHRTVIARAGRPRAVAARRMPLAAFGRMRAGAAGRALLVLAGAAGRALLLLAAALSSGCYTYVPVDRPPAGSIVRVRVPVQSPLPGRSGAPATASLEGRLLAGGDTLALAAQMRTDLGPYRQLVHVDTVLVARDDLASLEVQELSVARSIVLGVVIAGAVVAAVTLVFGGDAGGEPRPPTIPPQPALVGVR